MDKQEARRDLHMCAYCGQKIENGHWTYRGNIFCSGACLLEFAEPSDSNYAEIVRLVQERMVHEIVHEQVMEFGEPHRNRVLETRVQKKVVPRAEEGVFSEANRFRSLDY